MRKRDVPVGTRIGNLIVIGESKGRPRTMPNGNIVHRRALLVRCDCGTEKSVDMWNLARRPEIASCGCVDRARLLAGAMTTHGGSSTPEFKVWSKMKSRCLSPSDPSWNRYGGRGIAVCERWLGKDGFSNFLADMGKRPSATHEIDRRNNDGNYEPANCRWLPKAEQARNRSTTKMSVEKAAEARRRVASGELQIHVARDMGVTVACINTIVHNKSWRI